jgi:RNA polymerase sigma-70 factor (ECF subfamily)
MGSAGWVYNACVAEGLDDLNSTLGDLRAGAGIDEQEFRRIYDRHAREVLRYAIRCAGQRPVAEEWTSEAFLRLYREGSRIDPQRAAAWLMTTVKNLARDYWRKVHVEQKHLSVFESRPVEAVPKWKWDDLIEHPSLKPEHRVCLTLKYVHGMDRKQIVDYTGLTQNQVKSCIQYGLRLLRQAMRQAMDDRK